MNTKSISNLLKINKSIYWLSESPNAEAWSEQKKKPYTEDINSKWAGNRDSQTDKRVFHSPNQSPSSQLQA